MVVEAVLLLDGDIGAEQVRDLFDTRLLTRFPSLAGRPGPARGLLGSISGLAAWRPGAAPDLETLISEVRLPGPLTQQAVQDQASALVSATLDPWTTPWRVDVLRDGAGASTALLIRLHHSIGDGVALVTVLNALLDEPAAAPDPLAGPPEVSVTLPPGGRHRLRSRLLTAAAVAGVVPAFLGILAHAARRRLPLRDSADGTQVAWSRPHDLDELKATAAACGASLNDVLLAAVAGGLRQYLLARGLVPDDARVIVPVDLRPPGVPVDDRLGNHIGVLFVDLPVSADLAVARVAAVRERTRRLKRSLQPASTSALLRIVGVLPRPVQLAAAALLGRAADAVVSNVPGPTQERHLAGRRLRSVVFWVPRVGPMTLGVSVFSYAGTVSVGVVSTRAGGGQPPGSRAAELLAAVDAELVELSRVTAREVPDAVSD